MNYQQEIDMWTNNVVNFWQSKNIALRKGAAPGLIEETEILVGISFPAAFKALYEKVNGFKDMEWNEYMFTIWPLERIVEEYNYGRHPGFVGFCDYLINSHWIGFVKDESGVFKQYDLKDHPNPEKITESFVEAIEMINFNARDLY